MIKVLIVEDEPPIARAVKQLICRYSDAFQVVGTEINGRAALERLGRGEVDVVFTDIRMPVMDGIEATRRIRSMGRADTGKLPIIAMTANAFEEDKKAAEQAGMSGYLVKPIDMEAVIKELERVM